MTNKTIASTKTIARPVVLNTGRRRTLCTRTNRCRNRSVFTDLERYLLGLDVRFEGCRREEGTHVVQQRIDVPGGVADGNRHVDLADRIPGGGESASEREGPRQFRLSTTETGENGGRLGSRPSEFHVVLHRDGFCRPDVADLILLKGVSGIRLRIDGKSHKDFPYRFRT